MKRLSDASSVAGPQAETTFRLLEALKEEALRHEAVDHPYLRALATGSFEDPRRALQDFAREYGGYSSCFLQFLSAVEERLPEEQKRILHENKAEESGRYDEETLRELEAAGLRREWVEGIPHPELFKNFQQSLGVEPDAAVDPSSPVARWRDELLHLLNNDHPAAAVGALGLGTELIVSNMYAPVLRGVDRYGGVHPEGRSFLVLHALVDDSHAASLLELSARIATDGEARAALTRGMRRALDLRAEFWSALHEDALSDKENAA